MTGESLGEAEVRKVVTVLFCDVTGSVTLGETLDAESLRRVMLRYFDGMKTVVERHGGTVEKYIGDAIMAVFGVPSIHEDDAVRAVRAAAEMRETLAGINRELEQTWGVGLLTRTGVNTGEVVAGHFDGHLLVTGDAVNVAARLQQSAVPGDILVGEATYRLVRAAVVAEQVEPLALKGKAEPVAAWRLLEVVPGVPGWTRRLDSPLVDRDAELELLRSALARAAESASCELVALAGLAGVGKSRLTAEFLSDLGGRVTVVSGRCLPYGDGITFWPVAEMIRDAVDISVRDAPAEAAEKLSALLSDAPEGELVHERLAALVGLGSGGPAIEETFWSVRKLCEHLAARRPLVAVFDDIHWGQPTFLDLLEYLADRIRTAPVLVVCLARPELLEANPGWNIGKSNVTHVSVEPLSESDTDGLISNLVGGELVAQARRRIAGVAEGNPLFVEETLRMLIDDGVLAPVHGGWEVQGDLSAISIPPTIHALLTARLERLTPEERAVIERASVIGRVFWWGGVTELAPEELRPGVPGHLQSLMRKELIQPVVSRTGTDDAFRFAHILVRDAAYRQVPKAVRAELHERLATWIESRSRDQAGEYEEIVGYHLEQACTSLLELGPPSDRTRDLGRRAAKPLASAGRRAYARGDMPAAVNLLSRAASLLPVTADERAELLPELGFALHEIGDFHRLEDVTTETRAVAEASGDRGLEAHVAILGMWLKLHTDPVGWADDAQREALRASAVFQALGDERGLARAWSLLGGVHMMRAELASAERAWERAAAHADRVGDRREEMESRASVPLAIWSGPSHVDACLLRCEDCLRRARGDKKALSSALMAKAVVVAGLGRFGEARALIAEARALLEEVVLSVWSAGPLAQLAGWVELLAGDPVAAERELRRGFETLSEIGELAWLSTTVALLAEAVYEQGRYEEAEQLAKTSESSSAPEDAYSQVAWRSVRAKVLARHHRPGEAEMLARECVSLVDETDFLPLRWRALMTYGEVLHLIGRPDEATTALESAVAVAEEKGDVAAAQQARELMRVVEEAPPASGS